MEDHQRAKEASPQDSDQRLAQPWPEPGSNETGEQRADQCSYPKARPEQAVSLDSNIQDLVAVERQSLAYPELTSMKLCWPKASASIYPKYWLVSECLAPSSSRGVPLLKCVTIPSNIELSTQS